jgi:hypothetical protein
LAIIDIYRHNAWFINISDSPPNLQNVYTIFAVIDLHNIVDGVYLAKVPSCFLHGQQGSRDFVSHLIWSPIGWEDLQTVRHTIEHNFSKENNRKQAISTFIIGHFYSTCD